ncbi:MAG: leucine-rich repeat domain-containing protein [Chlamydiales bacterium]|nr:leucine-rich repeat domain-containing protein [Chlamydiales bacterium]
MTSPVRESSEPSKFDLIGALSSLEPALFRIMQYSVGSFLSNDPHESKEAVATGRSIRLVSKLWKDIADDYLPKIYGPEFEKMPLIGFRHLMVDAQLRAHAELQLSENEEPDYFSRFLALTSELRSRGAQIPKELSVLSPHYYLKEQRLFDEALEEVWSRINRINPLPAEQIRAIFYSSQGQERIQSITRIDLSDLGLTILPPEIKLFTGLEELCLNDNQLEMLPEWISSLTRLKHLSLNRNCFSEFPHPIISLSQLEVLIFKENTLIELPDSIVELRNLRILKLKDNEIATLPECFSDLSSLRELNLAKNQLTDITAITGLSGLKILDLSENEMADLDSIGNLTSLKELDLGSNHLTELPEEMGQLGELKRLYVEDNDLKEFPEEIFNLPLNSLVANNNQLVNISSSIDKLNNLRVLSLHHNQLTSLPSSLYSLELEKKTLEGNPLLCLFNKDLDEEPVEPILNGEGEDITWMTGPKHEACNSYICTTLFAQLCQAIYRGESKDVLRGKYQALSEEMRRRVFHKLSHISNSWTYSFEEIVFGKRERLIRALLEIAREELGKLPENEKEAIYEAAEFLIEDEKQVNAIQVIDSVMLKKSESSSIFDGSRSPPLKKRRLE